LWKKKVPPSRESKFETPEGGLPSLLSFEGGFKVTGKRQGKNIICLKRRDKAIGQRDGKGLKKFKSRDLVYKGYPRGYRKVHFRRVFCYQREGKKVIPNT